MHWIANRVASILQRVAPLWAVLNEAAGVDAKAAVHLEASLTRRPVALRAAVDSVPAERLRRPVDEIVDAVWALTTPEIHLLLRSLRGWTHEQYEAISRRSSALLGAAL